MRGAYDMVAVVGIFDGHPPLGKNASAGAADLIRQAILGGHVSPGQRLKEEELAQQLGISRTPVREALLVLQTEGLVEASPNRGATVRTYELPDLADMYELRALLEGNAARRAATRIDADSLQRLHESCARFQKLVGGSDLNRLVAENALFHETILAAADSDRLAGMVRQVIALPLVYKSYIWYSPEQATASYHCHRQLTNALERRDPSRAEAIMREHVYEAGDVLVQHMDSAAQSAETREAAA
jgi:DNA-binding GntR family transcriptional regulator